MDAVGNKTLFEGLPLPPSPSDLIRGVSWSLATLSPPLLTLPPQLSFYILRMASQLEVVSMTADIEQQQ
jgi:hypothetical protein